jgi:hypothetical protein
MTMYSALSINLSSGKLFLTGTWTGKKEDRIIVEDWEEYEIDKFTVQPPLILDGITREDEIEVRDCAHQARLIILTAQARNTVIDEGFEWHHRMQDVTRQFEIDKEYEFTRIYEELTEALTITIETINKRTIRNLRKSNQATTIGIPMEIVSDVIQAIDKYYDELQKQNVAKMKMTMTEYINTLGEPLQALPEAYVKLKEAMTNLNDTAVENDNDDDDTTISESEMKPASVQHIAQDNDNSEEEAIEQPTIERLLQEPSRSPPTPIALEDAIPEYRPTNEPIPMKALANKIMSSEFGKLKDVRKLTTPFEIILSFAIYLIAMVGQSTVSNTTSDKNSGVKGDWYNIKEEYRMGYIRAFYATFNNYNQIVKRGLPYRKDYTENGVVAAMTLIISTAIGTSDETFMKALDEVGWETTIYPFIAGRRRIALAEQDVKQVIDNGKLFRSPEGNGIVYPSILDFYHHTKKLHHIRMKTPKVSLNKIKVTRDNSEDEGPKAVTMDYYEWSSDITRTGKDKDGTREDIIIDIDAAPAKSLRQRKSPPIKPPIKKHASATKQPQINRMLPLPTTPKKTIVGRKRQSRQASSTKKGSILKSPPEHMTHAQSTPKKVRYTSMEYIDEDDDSFHDVSEEQTPPEDDTPYLYTVDSSSRPQFDYQPIQDTDNIARHEGTKRMLETMDNQDDKGDTTSKKNEKSD